MLNLADAVATLGNEVFASEAAACDALAAARWPSGVIPCPHCHAPCTRTLARLRCRGPRRHSSTILAGTPLGTKLKPCVRAVLLAVRAISRSARSISAAELAGEVGMNRVTLWRHLQSLRASLPRPGRSAWKPAWKEPIARQTIRTWLNGTFHGVRRGWRHRYEQEIRARWLFCAGDLLDICIARLVLGGPAFSLAAARRRARGAPRTKRPPSRAASPAGTN